MKTEIENALKKADGMLSRMVVSGDNVMLLAAARSALLSAFDELKKEDDAECQEIS